MNDLPTLDIKRLVRRNLPELFPHPRLSMEELFTIGPQGLQEISDTAIVRKLDEKEMR